jgi:hypothetical protein
MLAASFVLLLALLVTACAPGSGGSNLSVQEVLQKSADAMKNLKSSHVDGAANIQLSGTPSQTTTDKGTPTAATPSNVTMNIKASGVQQLPQQMQLDINIGTIDQTTKLTEVMTSDKVYIQSPHDNKWYVTDRKNLEDAGNNYFSGVTIDTNSLLASLQKIKLEDHGNQTLDGQDLRHITAILDKDTFKQIVQANPQLKNAFGQQDIDSFLNNVKTFSSSVDLWIDEQNFYLHQTQLKLDANGDTSTVGQGVPSSMAIKLDTTVKLSKFNEPVTVTPPTEATPIDNPNDLFGNQKP